jgi:hypothetical protein
LGSVSYTACYDFFADHPCDQYSTWFINKWVFSWLKLATGL